MPLQLTVTRNRKRSRNYHSEEHGLSLTVELDHAMIDQPQKLQEKISDLYREVDAAMDLQVVNWPADHKTQQGSFDRATCTTPIASNGSEFTHDAEHGQVNGNGRQPVAATPMSAAQRRAIDTISQRMNVDAAEQCLAVFDRELAGLTVREASALIEHLLRLEQETRRCSEG